MAKKLDGQGGKQGGGRGKGKRIQLTEREREIANLLAGRTDEGIADIIGLTPRGVRYHVHNMLVRFGVRTKYELIEKLRELNYID